ncbi:hypothetical protein ADUPG1_006231, partial [Aduncisulcus paluster]
GESSGLFTRKFTHISIPFSPSTPIKGAYICLSSSTLSLPIQLIFTFSSSTGKIQAIKYYFNAQRTDAWFFLPIDISDVVGCEIEGNRNSRIKDPFDFEMDSLSFIRGVQQQLNEIFVTNMWRETSVLKSELKGMIVVNPLFKSVKAKDSSKSRESKEYDESLRAERMLKRESNVWLSLSHLSIPFPAPSSMKGAYICVNKNYSSSSLLFTFTLSNGKKIPKKYEFSRYEYWYELHFLPIDLTNVVRCKIEGKGMSWEKNERRFRIKSLIFIQGDIRSDLKRDSLTSSATITPQCIIGQGGFGEVILVKVEGIPIPCVLKKMLRKTDEKVMKDCQREFKVQRKLFNNSKCFNRIPRPLYILDLLDADLKGVYGFLMEFCIGGSVSSFAKRWCVVDKSESQGEEG